MLTPKQKVILEFIEKYLEVNGYAPSYREIADHFGFSSVATVAEHVENLKLKGYLSSDESGYRALKPTEPIQVNGDSIFSGFSIPLFGAIQAGKPIEAIRTSETLEIPRDMMSKNVFALKVKGDSMMDDGILDGDFVVVEPCNQPRNGDIVVALIDKDNVTLKRFYREKDHIRLQPANRNYQPIRVKKVTIQGKVRGVIRKFG
ncbi:repressor LexA [Candidatus Berkelbacteria bacterium RIFCSPLOWO2_01_FULL_50_28]|uniref:LexA repressor n=1 Tax=Candidatus Berkelbacteria bacterium RIFCSPLOWO2_01_FULL_50_28 TaxID=1797471 RepID=A0A1F5EBU8_9BACT|nr:MAG: repressor LexA [Candidatus Berkelbacteria bacterium RIFCSPHIGHO2_01_FULL_50_36]OGD62213.1 MAG: repressor LexA [Candidatus Berkelbacteria bacterium RIFCSPHIGHO2_12_FULL_50_11]OGD64855.1 MAG: repressor LexA [Candidatus Berkelbacteria bacterium RIFCSPLOWO2_01_FULL_50_28]